MKIKVTVPPSLGLPKVYCVEIARSDLYLLCACVCARARARIYMVCYLPMLVFLNK